MSHVIPALIKKCVEAVEAGEDKVEVWGTGRASREYLYVDDAAEAIVLAAEVHDGTEPINLGTDHEVTIRETVETIARLVGFDGELRWDPTKPDGQPRRRVDATRAEQLLGWRAPKPFEEGLRETIDWYRANRAEAERDPNAAAPGWIAAAGSGTLRATWVSMARRRRDDGVGQRGRLGGSAPSGGASAWGHGAASSIAPAQRSPSGSSRLRRPVLEAGGSPPSRRSGTGRCVIGLPSGRIATSMSARASCRHSLVSWTLGSMGRRLAGSGRTGPVRRPMRRSSAGRCRGSLAQRRRGSRRRPPGRGRRRPGCRSSRGR